MTDANAEITYARAYDPYGVVTQTAGTGQSAYGYTSEWTDASGLVYLRARYYAPSNGRLISKDLWQGNANKPISYNKWLYSYDNPILYTDPSGLRVTRDGVERGDFIYSCNCGWLDVGHAITSTTNKILSLLRQKVNPPKWTVQDERVLQLWIYTPLQIQFNNLFVVKNNPVSKNTSLALGILMAHEEKREGLQGWLFARQIGHSYYSEEDLTSDLIGYYLAINNKSDLRYDDGFNWLAPICKMPSTRQQAIEWSLKVFDEYGDTVEEWEKWANPRLLCSSEIDSFCGDAPRSWPTRFSLDSASKVGADWRQYNSWNDGLLIASGINQDIYYLFR